jgi:nitroreductase
MYFNHSSVELIRARVSCRTFSDRPVDDLIRSKIGKLLREASCTDFRFVLADKPVAAEGEKIGSYGIVKNANLFIVGIVRKGADLIEFGAVFETIVLAVTDAGLGSVWLGATFDKKGFDRDLDLASDEFIPIVIPIGYPDKRRMVEKAARFVVGSDSRKKWNDLFFFYNFFSPYLREKTEAFRVPLEMVRLAPSAMNKQPWRVLHDDHGFHFYMARSITPDAKTGFNIQLVDMGIALCHFVIACHEAGLRGILDEKNPGLDSGFQYVRSYLPRTGF